MNSKRVIQQLTEEEDRYLGQVDVTVGLSWKELRRLVRRAADVTDLRKIGVVAHDCYLTAHHAVAEERQQPAVVIPACLGGPEVGPRGYLKANKLDAYALAVASNFAAVLLVGPKPALEQLARRLAAGGLNQ